MEIVNTVTGASTDTGRQFITKTPVTPAKSPATTPFTQVTTSSPDSQITASLNGFISSPPPQDKKIITQNNTLTSRFPLVSSVFWLGLLQDE